MDPTQDRAAQAAFDGYVKLADLWRPIETAPKDGTRVLGTDGQNIEVIFCTPDGWFNQSAEMSMWRVFPPTFWMPLPPAPTAGQE